MKTHSLLALAMPAVLMTLMGCVEHRVETTGPIADASGSGTQPVETVDIAEETGGPKTALAAPIAEAAVQRVDAGSFTGNVYRNEFFGMSVTIPEGWSIHDREDQIQVMTSGAEFSGAEESEIRAMLDSPPPGVVSLFAASVYPLDAGMRSNSIISSTAVQLAQLPGVNSREEFTDFMRRVLVSGNMVVSNLTENETVTIGDRLFTMISYSARTTGRTVSQTHYAYVANGQALSITVVIASSEQEAALDAIMQSIRFD